MNSDRIYWLRERLVRDANGQDSIALEFSSDTGYLRTPQFFRVPPSDIAQARTWYAEWGGSRPEGLRLGNTVKGPGVPVAPSIRLWRENGNH